MVQPRIPSVAEATMRTFVPFPIHTHFPINHDPLPINLFDPLHRGVHDWPRTSQSPGDPSFNPSQEVRA